MGLDQLTNMIYGFVHRVEIALPMRMTFSNLPRVHNLTCIHFKVFCELNVLGKLVTSGCIFIRALYPFCEAGAFFFLNIDVEQTPLPENSF